jgi:hypothetical protein
LIRFYFLWIVSGSGRMEQVVSNAEGGAPSTVSAQHSNDRLLGLYVLPKFPLDVTNALTNGDSSVLSVP